MLKAELLVEKILNPHYALLHCSAHPWLNMKTDIPFFTKELRRTTEEMDSDTCDIY